MKKLIISVNKQLYRLLGEYLPVSDNGSGLEIKGIDTLEFRVDLHLREKEILWKELNQK